MDASRINENAVVAGKDGGRSTANLVYILYIVGFFTGITALVGVIMAHVHKADADSPWDSHLAFQVRLFVKGLIFWAVATASSVLAGVISFATLGLGLILNLIPMAIILLWVVLTIMAIVKGMRALGRGEPIG